MMRIIDRGQGWVVEAFWLGCVRVVHGPDTVHGCIAYVNGA